MEISPADRVLSPFQSIPLSAPSNQDATPPKPSPMDIVTATQHNKIDRCKEILDSGAYDVNQLDQEGVSLLHWAAINNYVPLSRYLIDKGAIVNRKGGDLQGTPLHWAVMFNHNAMTILLLNNGADPNLCDAQGIPILHMAAQHGHTGIVAYLLAKNCVDVNGRDQSGRTALMATCGKVCRPDPARLLISFGAEVDLTEPQRQSTAAHIAATTDNYIALGVLDTAGLDWRKTNSFGETAYSILEKKGNVWLTRMVQNMMWERSQYHAKGPRCMTPWINNSSFRLRVMLMAPALLFLIVSLTLHSTLHIYTKIGILTFTGLFTYFVIPLFMDSRQDSLLPCALASSTTVLIISSYYVILWQFGGLLFGLAFILCTVSVTYSFYRVVSSDPGFVSCSTLERSDIIIELMETKGELAATDLCSTCLSRRPLRSKHCSACKRCVGRMDHHCPWILNCVGAKNHHLFIYYLFWAFATLSIFLVVGTGYIIYTPGCFRTTEGVAVFVMAVASCHPWLLMCLILDLLHVIWVFGLLVNQLQQMLLLNMTTNEFINADRYFSDTSNKTDGNHGHSHNSRNKKRTCIKSPYNQGCLRNARDLFGLSGYAGPKPVDWLTVFHLDELNFKTSSCCGSSEGCV